MKYRRTTQNVPNWTEYRRGLRKDIPPELLPWLLEAGSLTDSLKAACSDDFSVEVLDQRWGRPRIDESRVLRVKGTLLAWIREVRLYCGSCPVVFARTVVPVSTLRGAPRRLLYLKDRPLGAFLFTDPGMQRGPLQIAALRPDEAMANEALDQHFAQNPLWARRSVFRLSGKPLLVTEVFLPEIGLHPGNRH